MKILEMCRLLLDIVAVLAAGTLIFFAVDLLIHTFGMVIYHIPYNGVIP